MRRIGIVVSALLTLLTALHGQQSDDKFPSEQQINLLITQPERAFDSYENTLQLESQIVGGPESAAKDREVLTAARRVLATLKANPSKAFNSPMGFLLVTTWMMLQGIWRCAWDRAECNPRLQPKTEEAVSRCPTSTCRRPAWTLRRCSILSANRLWIFTDNTYQASTSSLNKLPTPSSSALAFLKSRRRRNSIKTNRTKSPLSLLPQASTKKNFVACDEQP